MKIRPLILGLTLLAPAAAPAADLDRLRPAPRVIVEEAVAAFEPAPIERVEVVRIAPARRFVVFEDEPAVLYPRRAWFPRGWPAPARVGRIVYDLPRGPRYNRPVRFEPVPSDPPCLC